MVAAFLPAVEPRPMSHYRALLVYIARFLTRAVSMLNASAPAATLYLSLRVPHYGSRDGLIHAELYRRHRYFPAR